MIYITEHIFIDEKYITLKFIKSSGPGGQNVNKVSTACELRYDITNDPSLPLHVKTKLINIAGNRISKEGILLISGDEYRTQEQNKAAVMKRLSLLIKQSSIISKKRYKTRPSLNSVEKRLTKKKREAKTKKYRRDNNFDL